MQQIIADPIYNSNELLDIARDLECVQKFESDVYFLNGMLRFKSCLNIYIYLFYAYSLRKFVQSGEMYRYIRYLYNSSPVGKWYCT